MWPEIASQERTHDQEAERKARCQRGKCWHRRPAMRETECKCDLGALHRRMADRGGQSSNHPFGR